MKTIVAIEPTTVTLPDMAKAIAWLGYKPLIVCKRASYPETSLRYLDEAETIDVDTLAGPEPIVSVLRERGGEIAGIVATGDRFLRVACQVAEQLEVPGPDPALKLMTDKCEVVKAVPEYSPESILFELSEIPAVAIHALLQRHGRVICKPGRAAGGDGMHSFDRSAGEAEIRTALEGMAERFGGTAWLAQAAVEGTLVSLEGYVNGDELRPLGLSVRTRIALTETQNLFPRPDSFPASVETGAIEIQRELLRRVQFRHGYFHSEYLVDETGRPFLTDANLGRIGGAGVFHQICFSYGISPTRMLAHMIEVTLFGGVLKDDADLYSHPPKRSKCIIYGLSEPGVFQDVVAPASSAVLHVVLAKKGTFMAAHGRNNRSHLGTVAGLEEDVDAFARDLQIVTDKGNVAPLF